MDYTTGQSPQPISAESLLFRAIHLAFSPSLTILTGLLANDVIMSLPSQPRSMSFPFVCWLLSRSLAPSLCSDGRSTILYPGEPIPTWLSLLSSSGRSSTYI